MAKFDCAVGLKLKEVREDLKLNQSQFAAAIGMEQAVMNQLESGRRAMSAKLAVQLQQGMLKMDIPLSPLLLTAEEWMVIQIREDIDRERSKFEREAPATSGVDTL